MSIYAVNEKEPIAAWIPSLDTAGNGTTVLTDLVGTTGNGTLTNMDAATDWVADTDAGGVRALDFDGANDKILFGAGAVVSTSVAFSFSCWVKSTNLTTNLYPKVATFQSAQGTTPFEITLSAQTGYQGVAIGSDGVSWGRFLNGVSWVNIAWQHIVVTYSGASGTTAGSFRIYVNGAVVTPSSAGAFSALTNGTCLGAAVAGGGSNLLLGRLDDLRFWSATVLDSSDVSYLYNSGAGRGRVSSPVSSRRRRQSVSGGVL